MSKYEKFTLDKILDIIFFIEKLAFDEIIKKEMQETIDREYRYFSTIDNMSWENSESNIFVQLADLYVGSINNIFSNLQINSENAKAKRQFAQQFLEFVGIDNISSVYNKNKNIEFINKCIQNK